MTVAPFGRRLAPLVENKQVGAYRLLTVRDDAGPDDPQPGQFYMLAAEERWGAGESERPYLPRAFSFARAREGQLSFLLEDIGPGTHRLAELEPGENLWLTGPLGIGFDPPGARPILVGGGIGILSWVTWLPAVGALLLLFFNRDKKNSVRGFANMWIVLCFLISIPLVTGLFKWDY